MFALVFRALADGWNRKGLITGWFFFVLLSALFLVLPFHFMVDQALGHGSLTTEKVDPLPLSILLELSQLHPVAFSSALNMTLCLLVLFALAHSLFSAGMFGSVARGRLCAASFFSDLAQLGPRFVLLGWVAFLAALVVSCLGLLAIALISRLTFGEDPPGNIAFRLHWLRGAWLLCGLAGWMALRDLMRWSLLLEGKGWRAAVGRGLKLALRRGMGFWFLSLLFILSVLAVVGGLSFARFHVSAVAFGGLLTLLAIWLRGWLLVSLMHAEHQLFLTVTSVTPVTPVTPSERESEPKGSVNEGAEMPAQQHGVEDGVAEGALPPEEHAQSDQNQEP